MTLTVLPGDQHNPTSGKPTRSIRPGGRGLVAAFAVVAVAGAGAGAIFAFGSPVHPPHAAVARTAPTAAAVLRSAPTPAAVAEQHAFATASAKQILATARGAALLMGSVKTASFGKLLAKPDAPVAQTTIDLMDQGQQAVTSPNGTFIVIVVPGATYVNGDETAMVQAFGWPKSEAAKIANHWLRYVPSSPGYEELTSGITLPSVIDGVAPIGTLTKTALSVKRGQQVIGISGLTNSALIPGAPVAETYWISTVSPYLPVEVDIPHPGHGEGAQLIYFTGWGVKGAEKIPPASLEITHR